MVKHGRTKKRRAGRIGRVKLKNRSWVRFDPKPRLGDPSLKQIWDPSKSAKANLDRLGLCAQVNESHTMTSTSNNQAALPTPSIELFSIPQSEDLQKRRRHPMKLEEEQHMVKCMQKYGEDYQSMFRDIKTNDLQYTEDKLRKLGKRFLLLKSEQRRVPVPDSVQPLLSSEHGDD